MIKASTTLSFEAFFYTNCEEIIIEISMQISRTFVKNLHSKKEEKPIYLDKISNTD